MKDIMDLYIILEENIYYKKGLLALFALLGCIILFFNFHPFGSLLNFSILVFITFSIICFWLYIRRIPIFKKDEIGILFSPYGNEDVRKDIERLREELMSRIKNNQNCKNFVLKTLPPNRVISDVDAATMIRRKSRCLLLIWGRFEKGSVQSKELRGFLPGRLNFTYAYPTQFNVEHVRKDIEIGVANRAWMFSSENDLIERDFICANFYEVSRYIVGTCVLYFGNVQAGKEILHDIIKNPTKTALTGNAVATIKAFYDNIRAKISRCDALLAYDIYRREIFVDGKLIRNEEKLKEIIKLTDTSIKYKHNSDAYTVKAIALFLLGRIGLAKKEMTTLRRREPINPSPCYSLGFLFAYEGNLRSAEDYYYKGFAATFNATGEYLFHLSEFVEAVLEQPDGAAHFHLHYVLGLIHKELIDPQAGLKQFEKFLIAAENYPDLLEWSDKAREYVSAINTNLSTGR